MAAPGVGVAGIPHWQLEMLAREARDKNMPKEELQKRLVALIRAAEAAEAKEGN